MGTLGERMRQKEGNKYEQGMTPAFNRTFKRIKETESQE